MIVRPAHPADAPALAGLETAFPMRRRWSEVSWLEEISGPGRLVEVAEAGTAPGRAGNHRAGETVDLDRIIVAGEHRRRGIAAHLLESGLSWATKQGARNVMLEVADDNPAAIELYRGAGFAAVARRASYYGGADALVLEMTLAPEGVKEYQ